MKLWLLTRKDEVGYDEFDSFIVRAETEQEARAIVQREYGNTQKSEYIWNTWTDDDKVSCEEITVEGESKVILGSFNAG